MYLQKNNNVDVDVSQYVLDKWRDEDITVNTKVAKLFANYT